MLKFLELYRNMQETHPNNLKMVAVSTSRVFLQRIMMPWLLQCGIQVGFFVVFQQFEFFLTNIFQACLFAGDGKKKQAEAVEEFRSNPDVTVMCVVVSSILFSDGFFVFINFCSFRKLPALWV